MCFSTLYALQEEIAKPFDNEMPKIAMERMMYLTAQKK